MIHQFFDSFRVIGRTNRIKSIKLLIILVFVVCLELLSIGLIVPILSGLFDIEQNYTFVKKINDKNSILSLTFLPYMDYKVKFLR